MSWLIYIWKWKAITKENLSAYAIKKPLTFVYLTTTPTKIHNYLTFDNCLFVIPTIYIRMSRIMTMAVWWSFHAWFNVCRKLLFKEFRTSSLTWWGREAEETRQYVIVAGRETWPRPPYCDCITHPSIIIASWNQERRRGCLRQRLTFHMNVKGPEGTIKTTEELVPHILVTEARHNCVSVLTDGRLIWQDIAYSKFRHHLWVYTSQGRMWSLGYLGMNWA